MASPIRIFRKVLGYVLLVINLLLSFISFTAIYSVVNFMSDQDNIINIEPPTGGPVVNSSVIDLGTMTVNNTGLFDIDDLSIELALLENNSLVIKYNGTFGSVPAQQKTPLSLYFANTSTGTLYIYGSIPGTWTDPSGYLTVSGKYAFRLFGFTLNLTEDLSLFITLP